MTPLATIAIPTYNRARLLPRAVDSALAQDYPNLEIILVDNASTDGTGELCRAYAAASPKVRYVRHASNIGAARNFRAALDLARGEYFMWLADDDWLDPGYATECLKVLVSRPDVVMAGGQCRLYDDPAAFNRDDPPTNLLHDTPAQRVLAFYAKAGYNSIYYAFMRTEILRRIPTRNELAGDWALVAGMAIHGKVVTVTTAHMHRMLDGASHTIRNIVGALGLPAYQARMPRLTVAFNSARFVLNGPWPQHTSTYTRLRLSLLTLLILFVRYTWFRRLIPRRARTALTRRFA